MKAILVPTDFSKCAYNAMHFAIEIAKVSKAKIILLHTYQLPVPPPEDQMSPVSFFEIKEENINRLKALVENEFNLEKTNIHLETECIVRAGFAVDEIIDVAQENNVGLIVMGTQGASGFIQKYILGSNTANVIAKSKFPVMAIPEDAKHLGFSKILFAADFHEIKSNSSLHTLMKLALLFNSTIDLFTVREDKEQLPTLTEAIEGLSLDKYFERIPHRFQTAVNENTAQAIDKFVKESRANLLVTISHKHGYLNLLFNKSITRELAFHTSTPLLCLPEQLE